VAKASTAAKVRQLASMEEVFRIRIQEGKITHKNFKKFRNLLVLKCWMLSFEG
jgi:hypothetical protein